MYVFLEKSKKMNESLKNPKKFHLKFLPTLYQEKTKYLIHKLKFPYYYHHLTCFGVIYEKYLTQFGTMPVQELKFLYSRASATLHVHQRLIGVIFSSSMKQLKNIVDKNKQILESLSGDTAVLKLL
jgi:hypothetical protein